MLQRNRVFKKFLLSAAGLGVLVTIAACNQPQTTSEVAPAPDTTQAPTTEAPTTTQAPQTTTTDGTVAEVISDNDSFSILEEAIGEAGLESTLAQAGPYTIFAPTDEAFRALPPETLEALRQPENRDKLQQILSYHVFPTRSPRQTLHPVKLKPLPVHL